MNGIPKPWFPSLFTWEPVFNSKSVLKEGLRHRKGDDPREIYGAADNDLQKQNPITSLRWRFFTFFLLEVPVGLVRLPFRAIHLLMGDFVAPATAKARNEWLLKVQEWSLQPNRNLPPPSDIQRTLILAKWVMIELARHVGKVALCALAIIPLWVTAFCGTFLNPYDAAFVFGQIEKWCAREVIPLSRTHKILSPDLQLRISDFSAPCMQTKLVWMRRDLYRTWFVFNEAMRKNTLRSLLSQAHCQMIEKETFFQREGLDPCKFFHKCFLWGDRFVLNKISESNYEETEKYNPKNGLGPVAESIAELLQGLEKVLTDIEFCREKIRDHAINGQSTKELEGKLQELRQLFQRYNQDLDCETNLTIAGRKAIERSQK